MARRDLRKAADLPESVQFLPRPPVLEGDNVVVPLRNLPPQAPVQARLRHPAPALHVRLRPAMASAEEAAVAAALAEAGMAAEAAVAAVASASATPAASEPSRAHATDLVLLGHLIASRILGGDSDFAKVWKEAVVPVAAASTTGWQVGMCAEITRPLVGRVSAHTLPAGTVGRIAGRADDGERWQLLVDGPKGQGTVEIKPELLRATSRPAAILSLWRSFPIAPSPYTAVREAMPNPDPSPNPSPKPGPNPRLDPSPSASPTPGQVREARRAVGESGGTIPLPVTVLSGFLGAGRRCSTISALYLP